VTVVAVGGECPGCGGQPTCWVTLRRTCKSYCERCARYVVALIRDDGQGVAIITAEPPTAPVDLPARTVRHSPTPATARAERDAAMDRADRHGPPFDAAVLAAVRALLAAGADFTADDVWDRMAAAGAAMPDEPRALGPVLRRLTDRGVIRNTGTFRPSARRHAAPISVWAAGDGQRPRKAKARRR
jgi:hypothetical protein